MRRWPRLLYDRIFNRRRVTIINSSDFELKVYICRRDEDEGLPKVRVEDGSQKLSGAASAPQGTGGELTYENSFHVEYELGKSKYPVPFHVFVLRKAEEGTIKRRKCWIDDGIACRVIVSRGLDEDACIIGFRAGDLRKIDITNDYFPTSTVLGSSCMPNIPNSTRPRVLQPTVPSATMPVGSSTDGRSSLSSVQPSSSDSEETKSDPSSPSRPNPVPASSQVENPTQSPHLSSPGEHGSRRVNRFRSVQPVKRTLCPNSPDQDPSNNHDCLASGESVATTDLYNGRLSRGEERGLSSRSSSSAELAFMENLVGVASESFRSSAEPDQSVTISTNQTGKIYSVTMTRSTSASTISTPATPSTITRSMSSLSLSSGGASPLTPLMKPVRLATDEIPASLLRAREILASPPRTSSKYHAHEKSFESCTQGKTTPFTDRGSQKRLLTPATRQVSFDGTSRASNNDAFTPNVAYRKTTPKTLFNEYIDV